MEIKKFTKFPAPESANQDGLVAIGGILDTDLLLSAYLQGIFPWPISDDTPVTWFAPENRGVVCIADAHYPKSFLKWLKKNPFYLKLNTQFPKIIQECALGKMRKSSETWLTDELIYVYHDLFLKKHAYSIECYNREDQLVGGLYGVALGNYFSGESMFFLESNASKYCLWALLEFLKSKKVKYLDTQMITPTVELFGGEYLARHQFNQWLAGCEFGSDYLKDFKIFIDQLPKS